MEPQRFELTKQIWGWGSKVIATILSHLKKYCKVIVKKYYPVNSKKRKNNLTMIWVEELKNMSCQRRHK
jgi:hypothetical protein